MHRYALWLTFIENAVVYYVNWWAVKQTATIRSSTVVCGLHFQQRLRSALETYPISRSDKDVFVIGAKRPKSDSFPSFPDTSQVKTIRAALYQHKPLQSAVSVRQNNLTCKNQRSRDSVIPVCLTFTWLFYILGTLSLISLSKPRPPPPLTCIQLH
jgi:hypothetical protein